LGEEEKKKKRERGNGEKGESNPSFSGAYKTQEPDIESSVFRSQSIVGSAKNGLWRESQSVILSSLSN
jgi:hypothetical protein